MRAVELDPRVGRAHPGRELQLDERLAVRSPPGVDGSCDERPGRRGGPARGDWCTVRASAVRYAARTPIPWFSIWCSTHSGLT